MNKTYQIRYNTRSTSENDRWRLIEDGNEILVSHIIVDGNIQTSGDYISSTGKLGIIDGIANIKTVKSENSIARHLAKTISWRVIGTIDTMLLGWLITGSLNVGLAIGGTEVITKMVLYFIHERIWFKWIKIGRN
jgi:uncharacterized membrane protein